jgi:hypothetical protein
VLTVLSTKDNSFVAVDAKAGGNGEIVNYGECQNSIIDALGFDSEVVRCRFDNNIIKRV